MVIYVKIAKTRKSIKKMVRGSSVTSAATARRLFLCYVVF